MSPPRRRWTRPSRRSTRSWRSGWPSSRTSDKLVEAQRIKQRTMYDVEMMQELGYCSGIENYSRVIEGRPVGSPPHDPAGLLPQGLSSCSSTRATSPCPRCGPCTTATGPERPRLVDYGFRLPCAFDNRPLKFEEFEQRLNQVVYVSATPGEYERERSGQIVEQVIRPTGLLDPRMEVRPVEGQIDDLIGEINQRAAAERAGAGHHPDQEDGRGPDRLPAERRASRCATCTTTSTPSSAWRSSGTCAWATFDVLVGINLLREGLDLPEVSLVAILDADKEGFLRSRDLPDPDHRPGRPERRRHGHHVRRHHHPLHAAGPSDETERRRDQAGRLQQGPRHRAQDGPQESVRELLEIVRAAPSRDARATSSR